MKNKRNYYRLIFAILFSVIIFIISYLNEGSTYENYMNTSFLFGLFFIIFAGSYYVLYSGYFTNFGRIMKSLFTKEDPSIDTSHWSFDKDEEEMERNRKIKLEVFLYSPLFISVFLIAQSFILIYFFQR